MANKKVTYKEPSNYFPKSVRKSAGIGEYANTKKVVKKTKRSK